MTKKLFIFILTCHFNLFASSTDLLVYPESLKSLHLNIVTAVTDHFLARQSWKTLFSLEI